MKKTYTIWEVIDLGSQIGISIVLPVVGGAVLGSKLDSFLNSSPKCTLALIFFGLVIGFFSVISIIRRIIDK